MSDRRPPSDDPRARREAELAEALRANLKRRKAAGQPPERNDSTEGGERADPPLPPSPGRS